MNSSESVPFSMMTYMKFMSDPRARRVGEAEDMRGRGKESGIGLIRNHTTRCGINTKPSETTAQMFYQRRISEVPKRPVHGFR